MRLRRTIACFTQAAKGSPMQESRPVSKPLPPWSQREQLAQRANRRRRVERREQVQKLLKTGALPTWKSADNSTSITRTVSKFRDADPSRSEAPFAPVHRGRLRPLSARGALERAAEARQRSGPSYVSWVSVGRSTASGTGCDSAATHSRGSLALCHHHPFCEPLHGGSSGSY